MLATLSLRLADWLRGCQLQRPNTDFIDQGRWNAKGIETSAYCWEKVGVSEGLAARKAGELAVG